MKKQSLFLAALFFVGGIGFAGCSSDIAGYADETEISDDSPMNSKVLERNSFTAPETLDGDDDGKKDKGDDSTSSDSTATSPLSGWSFGGGGKG